MAVLAAIRESSVRMRQVPMGHQRATVGNRGESANQDEADLVFSQAREQVLKVVHRTSSSSRFGAFQPVPRRVRGHVSAPPVSAVALPGPATYRTHTVLLAAKLTRLPAVTRVYSC